MIKNLTTTQILLIAMATILFLLAAFSFYLLQNPSAPMPFAPPPPSSTVTPLPPSPTHTPAPTSTSVPTRQTSYTPFTHHGTSSEVPITSETITISPGVTTSPGVATSTPTITPPALTTPTITPTHPRGTLPATVSKTLTTGEHGVTGRVVQNGLPTTNVLVEFADDATPRLSITDQGGHYWFITLAPGTNFTLTFNQPDNPQLTPVPEIAALVQLDGTLPTGIDIIELPDLEVSLNLDGIIFELQAPADGASFSAGAIATFNPLTFNWSEYNQGESYYIELGIYGNDVPIWTSNETTPTIMLWNGTLNNGNHITQGAYWWRVAAMKHLENYNLTVFTQKWDILFNP